MDLSSIPAFATDDTFHVVVETPRGASLKLKYEPRWETMTVVRPLPLGVRYPYDWGFVPSTLAPDGDPLDAMLLWDVASTPGVVVRCRAIAVLRVEQNRTNHQRSPRIRNDRIMAIPVDARRERDVQGVETLPARVREELEQFTLAAIALEGKDLKLLGWDDAKAALELVRASAKNDLVR
jgi:inorganic pyrophosphatase